MALKQHTVTTIGVLLAKLRLVCKGKPAVWFRGQAVTGWKLRPSIMRPPHSFGDEVVLLKKFKQNSVPLLETVPAGEAEWLFLMQHHGVPTRLLDRTESPLFGLYFAVAERTDKKHDSKDAALWCLYPHALNELAGIHMEPAHDVPSFGHETILDDYLPTRVVGIETALKQPVALIAPRPFRRLHAQQGVFTLFHRNTKPIEGLADKKGNQPHIVKFIIPARAKPAIRRELQLLQIDRLALFPELENVFQRIATCQP